MPGVALGQAPQGQIAAFNSTVVFNGFYGVTGATGVEPAIITHERAQHSLVAGDEKNQNSAHLGALGCA
jgi:hypothetical protein